MKIKILIILLFFQTILVFAKINITFINPGKSDERFWVMVSEFMRASSDDLGIELEIIYAERNFLKQVSIAREVANRTSKPDYMIIVNEKLIASRLLKITESKNIKTFIILNELNENQIVYDGKPREIHKNWLGTLVPNNINAGYMIANSIIKKAMEEKEDLKMLAIAGNRATPASVERVIGLKTALKENENIKLLNTVFAEWSKTEAYNRTQGMLFRYDNEIDLIWGVNDLAALGALEAVEEAGLIPGKDVYISGLNWSPEGLERVKNGELVATVGGHFMVGGWALVVIKDFHEGIDFLDSEGTTELKTNSFGIIDSSNVEEYLAKFGDLDWGKIDFKKFSKVHNTNITVYNFELEKILEQF